MRSLGTECFAFQEVSIGTSDSLYKRCLEEATAENKERRIVCVSREEEIRGRTLARCIEASGVERRRTRIEWRRRRCNDWAHDGVYMVEAQHHLRTFSSRVLT